ncbi:GNAT family N-acetyltransferase [Hyphococcus sp.]|uniref:GNAT family N-acetyltransferase n=1 Tax=Hyphococcus sp. TaxID=2038636 RepID=UPI0035C6BF63
MTAQGDIVESQIGADLEPAFRAALIPCAEAAGLESAMAALCKDLIEDNPFFAPAALLPALDAYGDEKTRVACVWGGDRLIGLWPVEQRLFYAKLPYRYWATWTHPHCYYGAPLIARGFEEPAFRELFALLCEGEDARSFARLGRIERDGPVYAAAKAAVKANKRMAYEAGAIARAVLQGGASAEATIAVHVRKKKRKEIQRLRNRLNEMGEVAVREATPTDDIAAWAEEFLLLEDKGWKGKKGTSLKSSDRDAEWFRQTLQRAHSAGELHFMRIDLGWRPIAMLATLLTNGTGYSLKICHDPDFDRFSPGVMIEIEAMRSLLAREDFRFADSCAAPDHSMINGLWRARRVITGLNVSGCGLGSKGGLALAKALEGARDRFPKE